MSQRRISDTRLIPRITIREENAISAEIIEWNIRVKDGV
jgi:hypothetical protein